MKKVLTNILILTFLFTYSLKAAYLPEVLVTEHTEEISALARLMAGEALGEPLEGKELVAHVAIQRAKYRGTTVRYQIHRQHVDNNGVVQYQFDGINTDRFEKTPTKENLKIAQDIYYNQSKYPKGLYFFANLKYSTDKKHIERIKNLFWKKVGNHSFYFRDDKEKIKYLNSKKIF